MKKQYSAPEMTIEQLETADIITNTSTTEVVLDVHETTKKDISRSEWN